MSASAHPSTRGIKVGLIKHLVLLAGKGSWCKMPLGDFQRGSGVGERQVGFNKVRGVHMCKELNKERDGDSVCWGGGRVCRVDRCKTGIVYACVRACAVGREEVRNRAKKKGARVCSDYV